ncbi:heterokaryon incompatibility protein-domain-containing protein [Podospora didyma]|uniref:Heterokaryon incompatibility protein-domain-containing protein n=1 Tax=Podospora didyma TaxID=330526 RepID=A0AAE0KK92_9PEZI|nr:heterokaryon incompatibility protein-domain-containing protein [Podospora didyma]
MDSKCPTCRNLQRSPSDAGGQAQIMLRTLRHFEESAADGCPYCRFIAGAISHLKLEPVKNSPISLCIRSTGACDLGLLSASDEEVMIQIYSPIGSPPAWPGVVRSAELSSSPDSQRAVEFILSCLKDCDTNHPECRVPAPQDPPTRLIDVGSQDATHVRLVETLSLDLLSHIPYVALSYCWGTASVLKTTTANLEAAKKSIPLSSMPRTLQDAVAVTRRLHQRFLWVDAICIIQDSLEDWEIESSRMATVYRNAYLTLAAGTAAAADEGFLSSPRQHLAAEYPAPYHVAWTDPNHQPTVLGARVIPGAHTHTDDLDEEDELPLDSRAWTLQERLLSTRILTYTRNELRWSCLSGTICECHLLKQFSCGSDHPFKSIFSITDNPAGEAFKQWHVIVEQYAIRRISYRQDRLPALSGIAKVVQDITGSEYVAGLWRTNLIRDLAWDSAGVVEFGDHDQYHHPITMAVTTPEYIAPTFSWASLPGGVSLNRAMDLQPGVRWVPRSTVEDTRSVPLGQNPLGRVLGGSNGCWIKLRGHVFTSALLRKESTIPSGMSRYYMKQGETELLVELDMPLEAFEGVNEHDNAETSLRRSLRPKTAAVEGTQVQDGEEQHHKHQGSVESAVVYVFLLGQWMGRVDSGYRHDGYRVMAFLLLGLCPDNYAGSDARYERLGNRISQLTVRYAVGVP